MAKKALTAVSARPDEASADGAGAGARARRGHHHQERARPGVRLRPRGQDPPGERRRLRSSSASARTKCVEQSLSRFISAEETREFTAALREVVERGVTRNAVLNPRSASGEVIPTTLNASALRDADGKVIGAIGILRDMRELDKARAYAESLIKNAPDPVFVSDLEGKILQANDAVSRAPGLPPGRAASSSRSRASSAPRRRASSPPPCARSSSAA